MTIDRLQVIWGAPSDGGRHVIGQLTRERSGAPFRFWYEPDLASAFKHGFALLPAFPEHRTGERPYEARYLFATFADRIPSPHRTDAKQMLAAWGVEQYDDQFEILAKSGGLRATDRLELSEYRSPDDLLTTPLEFRIAGARYVRPEERATLTPGVELAFEREFDNPHDPCATVVATLPDGKRAGYVPRQYSALVAKLLDSGLTLRGVAIRELILPEDAGRWLVRVTREGS
jgi:hypothetical protein